MPFAKNYLVRAGENSLPILLRAMDMEAAMCFTLSGHPPAPRDENRAAGCPLP